MNILGLSCNYHDSAAALLIDGNLIAAAEEERFSRIKHDFSFPEQAIDFCFAQAGINPGDLEYVVFYEKPLLKFERIILTNLSTYPQSLGTFRESMISWLGDKLWIKGQIQGKLDIPSDKILFTEHHLSHAASAFFCSPFDEAAIITIDGVGEWVTSTIGRGISNWGESEKEQTSSAKSNEIDIFHEIEFPHSIGLLYSAFTAFLGFRVNN